MRYRLTDGGRVLDEGEGEISYTGGALCAAGLRIRPADIAELTETEQPYGLRLVLAEGPVLELTMLGRLRGQLSAQLTEARMPAGVGRAEVFTSVSGDLRLYDDCLVTGAERVPYSLIEEVTGEYELTLRVTGREPLIIGGLARRTTEFTTLLATRLDEANVRTAALLGTLLPHLGPIKIRALANVLRDGRAVPCADLDPALLAALVRPERSSHLDVLTKLGPLWLGVKQTETVRRPAEGVGRWHDSAPPPSHGYGRWYGTARANVELGRLTPEREDLDALPSAMLAFVLCDTGRGVVYEPLNRPSEPSYVCPGDVATVNLRLALGGFERVAGRLVPGDTGWERHLRAALG